MAKTKKRKTKKKHYEFMDYTQHNPILFFYNCSNK